MPNAPKKNLLIVHYGDELLRGSERCLINLIGGLNKDLFNIHLWSNHPELNKLVEAPGVAVTYTPFYPSIGFGYPASPDGWLSDYRTAITIAAGLIDDFSPALIICNSLAPVQWLLPISLIKRIPLISYQHTSYLPGARCLSLAFGASHIVGVSKFTVESFLADGFPDHKISVIYNGVEDYSKKISVDRNQLRRELGLAPDAFVLICIGALAPWKRVDIPISAMRLLAEKYADRQTTLLIIGDGRSRQSLEASSENLNIRFLGWQTNVADYLAIADCLVAAAEKEAFGLAVWEAASVGLPVIAVPAGGLKESIIDEENGLFAEVGNAQSFARQIIRLRDDPTLRAKLGASGRASYDQHYRVERMVEDFSRLIEKICRPGKESFIEFGARLGRLLYLGGKLLLQRLIASSPKN